MLRTVTLLGATGSIGRSTRDVVAENPDRLAILAVVGGRDAAALARVAVETGARFAALADEAGGPVLAEALSGTGIASGAGRSAVLDAVAMESDIVVSAISGAAGLEATFAALTPGRIVALANKECLNSWNHPWALACMHLAIGSACMLPLYAKLPHRAPNTREVRWKSVRARPTLTIADLREMLPVVALLATGHVTSTLAPRGSLAQASRPPRRPTCRS